MGFLSDFHMELISQHSIVHYIEYQFERELSKVQRFLGIQIIENLYDNNSEFMKRLICACDDALERVSKSYTDEKPLPAIARGVDMREPAGEILEHCIDTIDAGGDVDVDSLRADLDETNRLNGEEYYDFTDGQLEELISASHIIYGYRKNSELQEQEDAISVLKTTIKLVDTSSSANIFRQSFINVFSIFDAYVFDNLKEYFYKHPEELGKFLDTKNSERVKVALEDVLPFTSIEQLKNELVQRQFSGRYLSEIIKKLKTYLPSLFDGIDYAKLMEMIERRNIHLHHKGYVDEKYYSSFNIYSLSVGDYAFIDSKYLFINVFNTLSHFATNFDKVFGNEEVVAINPVKWM